MNPSINLVVLAQPDAVGKEAARRFKEWAHERLKEADSFSVALSGGSTPLYLHRALVHDADSIPWKKIDVLLGDERALPPSDDNSNFKMAKDSLLSLVPIDPERIHRPRAEASDLKMAAHEYSQTLIALAGDPPAVDLVFLGIGDDGHTASLFPGEPEPEGWVAATRAPEGTASDDRLSFTYKTLVAAKKLIVMVTGEKKAATLERISQDDCDLPMARIIRDRDQGTTILADQAAASRIARED